MEYKIARWIVSTLFLWVTTILPAGCLGAMAEVSGFWAVFWAIWLAFGSLRTTAALVARLDD